MRNLLLFIVRYNAFLIFFLLESFSIYLIIQNNQFHQAGFFNSTNYISGIVYEKYHSFTEYFHLKDVNRKLAEENAYLRSQLPANFYNGSFQVIKTTDTTAKQAYTYIPANVIQITTNRINNYITINKGSLQGIKPRMAVISTDGVVGIVKDVSPHFSVIISLLHKDLKISGRAGKEGFIGSVSWNGRNPMYAQLDEIPKQIAVKVGDKITTGGGSLYFPENIMIGTVEDINKNTPDNFYAINIKLSTHFSDLATVYVVNYIFRDEQQQLQEKSAN
jgi:rod shape-determining protein MreC